MCMHIHAWNLARACAQAVHEAQSLTQLVTFTQEESVSKSKFYWLPIQALHGQLQEESSCPTNPILQQRTRIPLLHLHMLPQRCCRP